MQKKIFAAMAILFAAVSAAGCVTPRPVWEEPPDMSAYKTKIDIPPPEVEIPEPKKNKIEPKPEQGEPKGTGEITIIPRTKWTRASELSWRLAPMGKIWRITVHHEGNPQPNTSLTLREVARDLELIRRTHLRVMRAGDIGYHYIIDRSGRIWEGRSTSFQGAHAGGSANTGNLGVMLLGNFEFQEATPEQKAALKAFLKYLMKKYKIPVNHIYTHRELKVTQCPGRNMQRYMNDLRRTLK